MEFERKQIEVGGTSKGIIGRIILDKLAVPETVRVTLFGKPIVPVSFNYLGHPIFSDKQANLFMFKERELKRKNGEYTPLEAEVTYEERVFDVPRSTFDSIDGIKKSLANLSDLNEMLENRSIYSRVLGLGPLDEFVIFGYFLLDKFGQVWKLEKNLKDKVITAEDVEDYETFKNNNYKDEGLSLTSSEGYTIPDANSICPCCGNLITVEDIKENPCVYIKGEYYHDSCWRNYRRLLEVDRLTRCLMEIVYDSTEYTFELLPNGYCNDSCFSHIPWILFHTVDGDIIIGWRKRVISIEWQENYKPFKMNIFRSHKGTKWREKGKRGIHAYGDDKAIEYLKKVRKVVDPNYSKW